MSASKPSDSTLTLGKERAAQLEEAIKHQVQYLQKLARQLAVGDFDDVNTQRVNHYKVQLERMEVEMHQTPPRLSNSDIDALDGIASFLNSYARELPTKKRQEYWMMESLMLSKILSLTVQQIQIIEKSYLSCASKASVATGCHYLSTLFSQSFPLKLDEAFFQEILSLDQSKSYLSSQEQSKLQHFLDEVCGLNFTSAGGHIFNIGNYLSYAQVYAMMESYLKSHPSTTQIELANALQQTATAKRSSALNEKVSHVLGNFSSFFPRFGRVVNGVITLQTPTLFFGRYQGLLEECPSSIPTLEGLTPEEEVAAAISQSNVLNKQLRDLRMAQAQLEKAQQVAMVRAQRAVGQSAKVMAKENTVPSLQAQFGKVLLEGYMPLQEKYLNSRAAALSWSNQQVSIYTTLLDKIAGFANAKSQFNFGSLLTRGNTTWSKVCDKHAFGISAFALPQTNYPGSYSGAKQKLANEKKVVAANLKNIKNAMALITTYMNDLSYPNGKFVQAYHLPQVEAEKMAASLKKEYGNLAGARVNLQNLSNILDQILIEPGYRWINSSGSHPVDVYGKKEAMLGMFSIEWKGVVTMKSGRKLDQNEIYSLHDRCEELKGKLQEYESDVIGGAKGAPKEALEAMNQAFKAALQQASHTSQMMQVKLQMTVTEVQQEWTIISTALQALNQIYMSMTQSIYSL